MTVRFLGMTIITRQMEGELAKIGFEIFCLAIALYHPLHELDIDTDRYFSAKESYKKVFDCLSKQSFLEDSSGLIKVVPKEGSAKKSFKYTYYSYTPVSNKVLRFVSGSFLYGTLTDKQQRRQIPERVLIDLSLFDVSTKVLEENKYPLNPRNVWSNLVDLGNNKVSGYSNQYSLSKFSLSFGMGPLCLFGSIEVDQAKEITKIVPKFIAKSYRDILQYYQTQMHSGIARIMFDGCLIGLILVGAYFIGMYQYKKIRELFPRRQIQVQQAFLLSDPKDKLRCKMCRGNISNVILECSHLCLCFGCYEINNQCPECLKVSATCTRLYL